MLYPYYWPLYKAGGPVQSIFNMAAQLREDFDFYFVSLAKDIDGSRPIKSSLTLNEWNQGPNHEKIYSTSFLSPLLLFRLVRAVKPNVLMINGVFHWHTTFCALLIGKVLSINVVISPRGMLQEWALKRGKLKKKIFLSLLKVLIKKNSTWHATDVQEEKDIRKIFGSSQRVYIAGNIPRTLTQLKQIPFPDQSAKINLVFLSLINPNKNLHLIINSLNKWKKGKFTFDIYGPIIDVDYWETCKDKIIDESDIMYKGSMPPWEVPKVLQQYHFFILPTQGENFGHAIFDALASGVPVIISRKTPWFEIDTKQSGIYIDSLEESSLDNILKSLSKMSPSNYQRYRASSYQFAVDYLNSKDYSKEYNFLNKDDY